MDGVHAMTDVTGFGLAGHLLEICKGSTLAAQIHFSQIPLIEEAAHHAQQGIVTGASARNWAGYGQQVHLASTLSDWQQKMLSDPQTSGGLLVACTPGSADAVLAQFKQEGFAKAAVIGELRTGKAAIQVD
jgi:selenide,water dikinase